MHCGRFIQAPLTRREMLLRCANGFGAVALAALMGSETRARAALHPFAPSPPHFAPRARSVIFLYMDGGPSQVDTFDYKPLLEKHHGEDPYRLLKVEPTQFANVGKVMRSPWRFHPHGRSGLLVSDLFPHVGRCADDLCIIRSMVSSSPEHTSANYFLHTGNAMQGRPSMGAWVSYGLGSENANFPGFIVLNGGLVPPGGLDNFNSGFLPATYQGSIFRPGPQPVANIHRKERSEQQQMRKLELVRRLDQSGMERLGAHDELESAIANGEMACRMQTAVPELMDIGEESHLTKELYGIDDSYGPTAIYGRQCLLSRRLVERGVRFIELTCPNVGADRWDQHDSLEKGHANNARAVDKPIAGLLTDLKSRGLLDSTLVIWAGEFGRTPFAQGGNGRDHNPFGFTIWLAGAGVRGGLVYGETDEWGYKVVRDRVEIHDLHATMLHLLGLDHKRLTVRFGGRDMRLTDVHGNVIREILA